MPELPEVETVVGDLRTALVGRRIVAAAVHRPVVVRHPPWPTFATTVMGTTVRGVDRQGKFVLCELTAAGSEGVPGVARQRSSGAVPEEALDDGDGRLVLVVHLGMTGHLGVWPREHPRLPHTHVVLDLDDGRQLRFADARRFGRVAAGVLGELRERGVVPRLGVDPLSPGFGAAAIAAALGNTRRPVKAALLDQSRIAGLGNIYADEVCHVAGVRPTRRCHRLTRSQRQRLAEAMVAVLRTAITDRGSSIDDYRDLWNVPGRHQEKLCVYGRGGQPCVGCGLPLKQTRVVGRTTVYCPRCQR